MFSRDEIDLNQLSFGISGGLIQSQLDETSFLQSGDFDPIMMELVQKDSYFNVDIGASYNYLDFYAHGTVKNAIETRRIFIPSMKIIYVLIRVPVIFWR
jgi:hypothetical protein